MSKDSESENEQNNANKITFAGFDKLNLKPFAESLFRIMEKGICIRLFPVMYRMIN